MLLYFPLMDGLLFSLVILLLLSSRKSSFSPPFCWRVLLIFSLPFFDHPFPPFLFGFLLFSSFYAVTHGCGRGEPISFRPSLLFSVTVNVR